MAVAFSEALIVQGRGLTPEAELTPKGVSRMDTAIANYLGPSTPMGLSGGRSFLARSIPPRTESEVMWDYAVGAGVSEADLFREGSSLESVGNAVFTKQEIVIPNGWGDLAVVTSASHMRRTLEIYKHVFGQEYRIRGIVAPEEVGLQDTVWEFAGSILVREALRGTKPGDHDAVRQRLEELIPGYADATFSHLAATCLRGLLKKA